MNAARWILAYMMMVDEKRREMKVMAHLLGTDISLFSERDRQAESADPMRPVRAIPLAAILNPEVYHKMMNSEAAFQDSEIPEDIFNMQSDMLASSMNTELDELNRVLAEKAKEVFKQPEQESSFTVPPDKVFTIPSSKQNR